MTATTRYRIPAKIHRVEEEIKRSHFITTLAPTPSVDAAKQFIQQINAEFADASHNCWAYVVGPPGSTAQIGLSDAGEPHGTAGRPMLTVLLHSKIGDICAVVTRYFGGTLLGKGGLVKAYSSGVQLALETLPTVEQIATVKITIVIEYSLLTPLKQMLPDFETQILSEEYAVDVTYTIEIPEEQGQPFVNALTELSNGQALIEFE